MNESNVKGRRSHHHMSAPPPTRGPLLGRFAECVSGEARNGRKGGLRGERTSERTGRSSGRAGPGPCSRLRPPRAALRLPSGKVGTF